MLETLTSGITINSILIFEPKNKEILLLLVFRPQQYLIMSTLLKEKNFLCTRCRATLAWTKFHKTSAMVGLLKAGPGPT